MNTLKNLILFSVCLYIFTGNLYSQPYETPGCGISYNIPTSILTPYKPSKSSGSTEEKLNVLMVHVCFADDNNQSLYDNFWPPHTMPVSPNNGVALLSPNKITTGNFMDRYPAYTISDYFCEMSMGQLDVVGRNIFVDLPQPYTSEYFRTNGYKRSTLNRFILQYIDANVDYAEYDNWRLQNNNWEYFPDGKIEMIVMNYRYIPNDPAGNVWFWDYIPSGASGEASLGNPLYFGGPLTLDGKTIYPDFSEDGSGVTTIGQRLNYSGVTQIIEHEIAHHFFVGQLNTVLTSILQTAL